MKNDLKDILSGSNKDIDNQKLMDYLSGHLSAPDRHEVENNMADDAFLNDAVEGLQKMTNKKDMQGYVDQLNNDLQKQTLKNLKRKDKRRWKDQPYTYFTIIIVLILLVFCFIVIKKYAEGKQGSTVATSQHIQPNRNNDFLF